MSKKYIDQDPFYIRGVCFDKPPDSCPVCFAKTYRRNINSHHYECGSSILYCEQEESKVFKKAGWYMEYDFFCADYAFYQVLILRKLIGFYKGFYDEAKGK